jgi:hypothetical protein
MWLFAKNSFVSVVQHREKKNSVLVRGRRRSDLERLFPEKANDIFEDPAADYRYRLLATKAELKETLARYIDEKLDYDNFKAAQDPDSQDWTRFLHQVWGAGYALQKH